MPGLKSFAVPESKIFAFTMPGISHLFEPKHGIHPKVVQERLGHSRIQIILDTYSHVALGLQEAAAKRFDEMLGQYVSSSSR